jgi:hypothetical protein
MKTHLLTLCAALLLLPTTALAAPAATTAAATPRNDEGAAVREQGVDRELIFDIGDSIEGEKLSPDGVNIPGRMAKIHASMIGIRGQFTNQLIWLSNDI